MEKNKLNEEIDSIKYMFEYQKGVVISEQGGKQIGSKIAGAKQKLKTFTQNTFNNQKIDRSRILDGAAAEVKTYLSKLVPSLQKGTTYLQSVLEKVKGDGGYEKEADVLYKSIEGFLASYSAVIKQADDLSKNIMGYHNKVNPQSTETQTPPSQATATGTTQSTATK